MQPFAFQAEVEELQSEEARLDTSIGYVICFNLSFSIDLVNTMWIINL